MAAELVKATDKFGGIEALTPFDIRYINEIGEVIRGGSEALRRDPILVGYAEAKSPLVIDENMCRIMIEYIRAGLPQTLDTMPNAGATAPMHPAGALAVGVAETLGGLVLCYAIDPDAVVGVDIIPSFADMSTGIFRYAGAERIPMLGARVQIISEYYGCPSGVHGGKTDSCFPDIRCGMEKGITMLIPALCGAVGFGTVGHLENAVTYSPVQLVFDNEIAGYVRKAIRGFEITDAAIDLDTIERVGPGGTYIGEEETVTQFRDLMHLSPFFTVWPWGGQPTADESRSWLHMADARVRELLAQDVPSPLTPEQTRAVDQIVAAAEKQLQREGLM
jgi:trimethylamine--corrinoid protein Co-methyltransferase